MSKLEELIQQYCPDGVEYKSLGEICNIKGRIGFRGYTRDDQVKEGEGALSLSPSNIQDGQMDYTKGTYITWAKYDESPEIMTFNGDIIFCKTASVGKVALVKDLPYKATINPQLVVLKDIQCNAGFLTYVLGSDTVQKKVISIAGVGSVPNVSQKALAELSIPVPPLPVQEEIVRILDTLSELQAELQAELQKRLQQYNYYRDNLLSFEGRADVEYKALKDILRIKNGKDYKHLREGSVPVYGSGGILTYVDTPVFCKPSVLIPRKGSIDKLYYVDVPFWNVDTVFYTEVNESIILVKYLFYILQREHLESLNTAGGVPSLTQGVLNEVLIKVPSLAEQQRIVDILDRFDSLTNDLTAGLPAEIEKRKQQYEYYRNKLLTFKRA